MQRLGYSSKNKGSISPKKSPQTEENNNTTFTKLQWDSHLPTPALSRSKSCIVIFTVAVICGLNSYNGAFVFDDSEAIVTNKDVTGESPITDLFYNDFWGNKLSSNQSHKSYRPFTVLTFRLDHHLAGGLFPQRFHAVNIFLHAVVSTLFLFIFCLLFGSSSQENTSHSSLPLLPPSKGATLCGLMFAVHPVHSENIAGVVGRADLLCAFCFLLSLLCYARSCSDSRHCWRSFVWLAACLSMCLAAVLFKEQGIMAIALCSLYDIFIIHLLEIKNMFNKRRHDTCTEKIADNNNFINSPRKQRGSASLKPLICRHIALTTVGVMILAARWRLMGSSVPVFQIVDNPHSFVNGSFYRALNYNYLYAMNCWILLLPQWLCFDWSMGCIPVITVVTDPRNLATIVLLVIFGFLIHRSLFVKDAEGNRRMVMALGLLLLPFLPASNLLFRVGFVVAERNLYLSSAGFTMLVVIGLARLSRQFPAGRQVLGVGIYLLMTVNVIRCIQRCGEWNNELTLFEAGEKVCPLNAKVHYNIGKVKADHGDTSEAIDKYRLAIQLNPQYDQAMNNLANILKDQGELTEAEALLKKAVNIRSDFAAAWMNLGITEVALKKYDSAETSYKNALLHRRHYPDCFFNLGNLYLEQKRHMEALAAWRNATLQKPTHSSAWGNMIILLDDLGHISDLELLMKEAAQKIPRDAMLYYNYANAMGKAGRYEESEKNFLNAIELDNKVASYPSNLGVLYHRWGRLQDAEKAYLQALSLDPNNQHTLNHLNMLRKKMKQTT